MRTIFLLVAVAIGSTRGVMAQSSPLLTGDSVRIELERQTISTELKQLSDSIQISILNIDARLRKPLPSKKEKRILTGRKKLKNFRNQIALNQEEISATGQNSWNSNSVERIRLETATTRREYKRILRLL